MTPSTTVHAIFAAGSLECHPDRFLPLNKRSGLPQRGGAARASEGARTPDQVHGVPSCPLVTPSSVSPTSWPSKTMSSLRSSSSFGDTKRRWPSASDTCGSTRGWPQRLVNRARRVPSVSVSSSHEGYFATGRVQRQVPAAEVRGFACGAAGARASTGSSAEQPALQAKRARSRYDLMLCEAAFPIHGRLAIVRLVGHVAAERGVVPEQRVLQDRCARADRLEEFPQVRTQVVIVVPPETQGLGYRLASVASGRAAACHCRK